MVDILYSCILSYALNQIKLKLEITIVKLKQKCALDINENKLQINTWKIQTLSSLSYYQYIIYYNRFVHRLVAKVQLLFPQLTINVLNVSK